MAWLATLLRNILTLSQDVPEEFLKKKLGTVDRKLPGIGSEKRFFVNFQELP